MAENTVIVKIREMILNGALAPGERVIEAALSERLNVSRTPVRSALPGLAKEGLLKPRGRRGYAVAAYSHADSTAGVELRAVLEGVAAKFVAMRGPTAELVATLEACLAEGDQILSKGYLTDE